MRHIDVVQWICDACSEQRHDDCIGPGHCYCQHRTDQRPQPATGPPGE